MNLPIAFRSFAGRRFGGRMSVAVTLAAVSFYFGGCAAHEAAANRELFLRHAPLPTLVAREEVLPAAHRAAAKNEGDFALLGLGRSMEPFYRAGTAVVVHPTSYHMLRSGMAVVYENRGGAYVAHMLLRKTERGWMVMGLNNSTPDDNLVTEGNLVGIIKEAFAAKDAEFSPEIGTQIAAYRPALPRSAIAGFDAVVD